MESENTKECCFCFNQKQPTNGQIIKFAEKDESETFACFFCLNSVIKNVIPKLQEFVSKHEDKVRTHYAGRLEERVNSILNDYESKTLKALRGAMDFRDQVVLQLRAFEICLEMTGNAQTHNEKNARLRGAIEIVDATIQKLQNEEFSIEGFGLWHGTDEGFVFRSNYPVRRLIAENRELKQRLGETVNNE